MLKMALILAFSLGLSLGLGSLQAEEENLAVNSNRTSERISSQENMANPTSQAIKTETDQIDIKKLSEAFGHFIGRNLQSPGLSFDTESIVKGIRDGASGLPAPLSDKERDEMMSIVQERAFKEMSATNLKAANDYLEKNRQVRGIVEVVPNKLQYMILKEGTGATVEAHASPKIHYTGKYQDGTVFGSSEEMGGPITIPLDQTIPGFSKGILGMKEGEKRRLFVHPDLGYGTTGQLPPNELLVFDVEVVKANSDEGKDKTNTDLGQDDEELLLEDDEEVTSGNNTNPNLQMQTPQQNAR